MLHSSINHVPTNLYGWSILRFRSSNASPSAPASFKRRLASARDFSISGQYPAKLLQLLLGGRQRRAREDDAADRLDVGDLGERRCSAPLVDRERERPSHPDVVEGFLLVIGRDYVAAVPIAALHDDLVAQFLLELIARRGRQAAELSRRAVGPDGIDADRLLGRIDAGEAVEIRRPG